MTDLPGKPVRNPSLRRSVVRGLLMVGGAAAILAPAWLPDRPEVPIERGVVELLQALLLAASSAVMFGTAPHAGPWRPVCRVFGLALGAAFVGEVEDVASQVLKVRFPESWVVGLVLLAALVTALRHRQVMLNFVTLLGNHAGAGLIAAALLILYVFNRVIGTAAFWMAALGDAYSPEVPRICRGYWELFACYLIFLGTLGLSFTLARRKR